MKRPNQYSKPLEGGRTESYHPTDYTNNQYSKDLNTYIDYLEMQQRKMYSEEEVKEMIIDAISSCTDGVSSHCQDFDEWFEQNKKK